jgi:U3 small nucleolar ribonucleoprotein protein IMP4
LLRDAETSEKRAKLRASLASGKPLDPTIADDRSLRKDFQYDESRPDLSVNEQLDVDDEYAALSGIVEPRVLLVSVDDLGCWKPC